MPLYPHGRETASIMALAPVIPVLTVASVEDGLAQAKALIAGGLYAIEVTLRTPSALEAIKAGKAYYGEASILGTPYVTGYEPIMDSSGAQIGVYYVGYRK